MTFRPAKAQWAKAAERLGPNVAVEMGRYVEDVKSGKIRTLAMPWKNLTDMTRALEPGGLTTICASPGHGKSLFVMQLSYHLHAAGVKCEMMMLEHPALWHAKRLYSQLAEDPRLTDNNWIAQSNGHVAEICAPFDQAVTDFFYHVHTRNNGQASYRDLLGWLEENAAKGTRYFLIDPVTGTKSPARPWEADQEFLAEARKIVEAANASLVLITHPRKGHGRQTGMDDMANGAAFARFTDCVLWLDKPEKEVAVRVQTEAGGYTTLANRVVKINKASNSIGGGMRLGLRFDKMKYRELGIVTKDAEKAKASGYDAPVTQEKPEDIANLFGTAPAPPKPWLQRQSDTAPGETA